MSARVRLNSLHGDELVVLHFAWSVPNRFMKWLHTHVFCCSGSLLYFKICLKDFLKTQPFYHPGEEEDFHHLAFSYIGEIIACESCLPTNVILTSVIYIPKLELWWIWETFPCFNARPWTMLCHLWLLPQAFQCLIRSIPFYSCWQILFSFFFF